MRREWDQHLKQSLQGLSEGGELYHSVYAPSVPRGNIIVALSVERFGHAGKEPWDGILKLKEDLC